MTMKTLPMVAFAALLPAFAVAQEAPADGEVMPAAAPETILTIDAEQDGFVPFKCPIEKIRSAYQNLVNPEDTLIALAIEKQTLAICRQSQEALIRIAENEVRLNELFEPIIAPPPPPPPPPAPEPEPEPEPEPVVEPEPILPDPIELIEIIPEEPPEPEFIPPDYAVAAIMKDPLGWKAMIVDGGAIYTVREGDRMDDGSTIVAIERGRVELISSDNFSYFLE